MIYIPKHFQMEQSAALEVIENNGFALLVSMGEREVCATHLPLQINREEEALYGHFALPNDQWKEAEGKQVMAVFQGPHCYISSDWYETNRAVPTWNYVAVHVYGRLEIVEDEKQILASLHDLVTTYEAPGSGYDLNELDPAFVKGMRKGIVPFRILIDRIEGKAKLSQNHSKDRRERVVRKLEQSGRENELAIADLMKKRLD